MTPLGAAAARLRAAVAVGEARATTVSVRLTPAQRSAFEIYVADPAHTEDGAPDGDFASAAQVRQVAECLRGSSLVIPVDIADAVWRVIVDAANSAGEERTPEGDRAARSLSTLQVACSKALAAVAKAQEAADPYGGIACPACGQPAVGCCRCPASHFPHTLASIQRGHGYRCAAGHAFDGAMAADPRTGAVLSGGGGAPRTLPTTGGVQATFGERVAEEE